VSVTTQKPTGETHVEADLMGGSYGTVRGRINAETALSDDWSLGVSLLGRRSDGWQKLDTGGALGNENSGARNMLTFQPSFFSILQSALIGPQARFTLMPDDVAREMAQVAAETHVLPGRVLSNGGTYTHRLAVRRTRELFNSMYRYLPSTRRRLPYNRAFLNGDDMAAMGVANDDWVEISSDSGVIRAIAARDEALRPGVVSISHGFGGLPDDGDYRRNGASTNLLISTDRDLQPINAMPRVTAIPVNIRPVPGEPVAQALS
jgi:hypothetical protein